MINPELKVGMYVLLGTHVQTRLSEALQREGTVM
jgi:hypothetical protein